MKPAYKRELERIYTERGRTVASEVVHIAAAEDNPLHPYFEWDDTVAG